MVLQLFTTNYYKNSQSFLSKGYEKLNWNSNDFYSIQLQFTLQTLICMLFGFREIGSQKHVFTSFGNFECQIFKYRLVVTHFRILHSNKNDLMSLEGTMHQHQKLCELKSRYSFFFKRGKKSKLFKLLLNGVLNFTWDII